MDPFTAPLTAHPLIGPAPSQRADVGRFALTLILGVALGATLTIATVVQLRPSGATTLAAGADVTDGWAHSPITRLGSESITAGVAITDGWAHSPITRGGSNSRAALLRQLAATYEAQGPAAEARSR
jgi:hypothetical protein